MVRTELTLGTFARLLPTVRPDVIQNDDRDSADESGERLFSLFVWIWEPFFGGPTCSDVAFEPDGIRLIWHWSHPERRYIGNFVRWDEVRDYDHEAPPPEVRLHDGRTVFISAVLRDELAKAAKAAGIPWVRREAVWSALLEPFLDGGWGDPKVRDAKLVERGIPSWQIKRIRARYAIRMSLLTFLTWEWCDYGQTDLISVARPWSTGWQPRAGRYCRFRRWTDEIADRPTHVVDNAPPEARLV